VYSVLYIERNVETMAIAAHDDCEQDGDIGGSLVEIALCKSVESSGDDVNEERCLMTAETL
jgi:hypothetical protein